MKGLLFTSEMARAACEGRKTQTRRVVSPQPMPETTTMKYFRGDLWHANTHSAEIKGLTLFLGAHRHPYRPGERVCLLTTWAVASQFDGRKPLELSPRTAPGRLWHAGMGTPKPDWSGKQRPGRFLPNHLRPLMPVFEIVSVCAERVQDISEKEAEAEGIHRNPFQVWHWRDDSAIGGRTAQDAFRLLWDSINAARGFGWEKNPWVWRIEFRRVAP